jgi:hypothetical protein
MEDFQDAFGRYITPLTPYPPDQSVTSEQSSNDAGSRAIQSVTGFDGVTDANRRKPSNDAGCGGVTVQNGVIGKESHVSGEDARKHRGVRIKDSVRSKP